MTLSTSSDRAEPPEPNPFTDEELQVWRGFLRTHRTITDELNQRLIRNHDLTLRHYGVLITLITDPDRQMRMTDVAERVLTSPSGMTRAIAAWSTGSRTRATGAAFSSRSRRTVSAAYARRR